MNSYYPSRANKIKSLLTTWIRLKNRLLLPANNLHHFNTGFFLNILVPGFSFASIKPLLWRIIFILYCFCFFALIFFAGLSAAKYAFTLMIFLHSISIVNYLYRELNGLSLFGRAISGLAISVIIYLFYSFIIIGLLDKIYTPITTVNRDVFVIKRIYDFKKLKPGDKIAYYKGGVYNPQMIIYSGMLIGTVIGKSGDKIEFKEKIIVTKNNAYPGSGFINNISFSDYVVPPDCLFVLPQNESFKLYNRFDNFNYDRFVDWCIVRADDYRGYIPKKWFCRWQYFN
ncbi:MAG: hypothetical protein ACP5MG_05925 [Verrucomicrobiia bacterium]